MSSRVLTFIRAAFALLVVLAAPHVSAWGDNAVPQSLSWTAQGADSTDMLAHIATARETVFPVTVFAGRTYTVKFEGEAGHVVNVVAQLLDNRYDPNVSLYNCDGFFMSVQLRAVEEVNAENSAGLPQSERGEGAPSTASMFWDTIAAALDSSPFCNMLRTVMLRLDPAPVAKSCEFVITPHATIHTRKANTSCQMRVFIQQTDAEKEMGLQRIFAFALPVFFILLTTPFIMWRIDLLSSYLADIDVVGWLWYLPYALRNAIVRACTIVWTHFSAYYSKLRTQKRQRRLEEQHRRIMEEAEQRRRMRGGTPPSAAPQQQHETCDFAQTIAGHNERDGRLQREGEQHGHVAVHIHTASPNLQAQQTLTSSSPAAAAKTAGGETLHENEACVTAMKKCVAEEKEQLLQRSLDANTVHAGLAGSPKDNCPTAAVAQNSIQEKRAEAHRNDSTEMASFCAVHVETRGPVSHESVADNIAAGGNDNNHRRQAAAENRAFLYNDDGEEEEENVCRICRDGDEEEKLISACECTGSVRWVHRTCLDRWRMESTKRNVRNVNWCEICKKPFNISIRRSTLLWQSLRQALFGVTLFISFINVFALITVFQRSTLGELSCMAPWHTVSYSTMFHLDGMVLTVFVHFLLTFLAAFSFAAVYSRWHVREETEAYVHEFQVFPRFWTLGNTAQVVAVYVAGLLQSVSFGYVLKFLVYRTSSLAWSWEISPFTGAALFASFLALGASFVRSGREFLEARSAREPQRQEEAQRPPSPSSLPSPSPSLPSSLPATAAGNDEQQPAAQTRVRPIRAMEYCPRRPVIARP